MSAVITDLFLAVAVLGAWLGCAGFVRLSAPIDRLHCVAFVNAVSGAALTVAVFAADGVSVRSGKMLLIVLIALITGAATGHAAGRAMTLRDTEE